jgi:hypothetical protein
MNPRVLSRAAFAVLAGIAIGAAATDRFEGDGPANAVLITPSEAPLLRDLEAMGGVADQDYFFVAGRPWRSYEARLSALSTGAAVAAFERVDNSTLSVVQTASHYQTSTGSVGQFVFLRWMLDGNPPNASSYLRVTGHTNGTASTQYQIELKDTTLFCPRYNNTSGQASVLLIQAAPEGANACSYTAVFFNESGTVTGTQSGTLNESNMATIATPAIAGLNNTKGSARIVHDCGYNNLFAKLVALEPATGYSFDTICSAK